MQLNVFCLPLYAFGHGILPLCSVTTSFVHICRNISVHWMHAAHLVAAIKGEYPLKPQIKMEYLRISAVLLCFCIVPGTTGGRHTLHSSCMSHPSGHVHYILMLCLHKAMVFFLCRFSGPHSDPPSYPLCVSNWQHHPQVSVWWCGECGDCDLGYWDWDNNSQPIHHPRTHCPLSHHHLSGGSGGQLHQRGSRVSLWAYFQQWITTAESTVYPSEGVWVLHTST